MTGMFPGSGVPPADAKNSLADPDTVGCDELWYSTSRCQPRFDPAAANATLSELINVIQCAGIPYDCSKLDNLCLAIDYIIRGGASTCVSLVADAGGFDFRGDLDPPMTALPTDCCMMIKATTNTDNTGPITRVNLNNLGWVVVKRNDGQDLEPGDIKGGIPVLLIYCNGVFYIPYLVPSQSPEPFKGVVTYWVRTDGSDLTGDGSANDPLKAFRTINKAVSSGMTNFTSNPDLTLDIRLGIPGIYEYAQFPPFPGTFMLTGDPAGTNFLSYKIQTSVINGGYTCIEVDGSSAILSGINMLMNAVHPTLGGSLGLLVWRNSRCFLNDCGIDNMTGASGVNNNKYMALATNYSTISLGSGSIIFDSHGTSVGAALAATANGSIQTIGYQLDPVTVTYKDMTLTRGGYVAESLSQIGVSDAVIGGVTLATVNISNTIGPKYLAVVNSFISGGGKNIPGSAAGSVADYGVFHA